MPHFCPFLYFTKLPRESKYAFSFFCNDVHFVCGKGKYTGLTKASSGKWTVKNEVSSYKVFFCMRIQRYMMERVTIGKHMVI